MGFFFESNENIFIIIYNKLTIGDIIKTIHTIRLLFNFKSKGLHIQFLERNNQK